MSKNNKSSYKGQAIPKEWVAFLESQNKKEELKNFSELESTDPFLFDALEGFSNEEFSSIQKSMTDLEEKVNTRANLSKSHNRSVDIKKLRPILYTGIAASLIVGSFYFIKSLVNSQSGKTQVAIQQKNEKLETQGTVTPLEMSFDTIHPDNLNDSVYKRNLESKSKSDTNRDNTLIAINSLKDEELGYTAEPGLKATSTGAMISELDDVTLSAKQKSQLIKGQVIDRSTNEPISGVNIIVDGKNQTMTSFNGNFEVKLDGKDAYTIEFEKKNYETLPQRVIPGNESSMYLTVPMNQSFMSMPTAAEKSTNTAASQSSLRLGLDLYSKGKYSEASKELDKAITLNPGNNDAVYYAGLSHFNAGRPGKSISYFDKILKSKETNLKEDASWYKAQALVQKGFKEDAVKILEKIASDNGKYSSSAKAELNKLRP